MAKMSSALKKKLAAAQKKWKKAKPASSSGMVNENVEDGNYTAKLTGKDIKIQNNKPAVLLQYTIEDEDAADEVVTARYWLETEQNLSYLKRDLGRFGYEVDDLDLSSDLDGILDEIVEAEPVCRISVRTSDEWQNVYLNRVDEMNEDENEEDEEEEDDDTEDEDEEESEDEDEDEEEDEEDEDEDDEEEDEEEDEDEESEDEDEDDDEEEEEDEDEDEDEEEVEIAKGDVVLFKAPRAKKSEECKVTSISESKGTANLKRDRDGKTFKGIKLELLEVPEDEDEEENDDEELAELEKGSKVIVNVKGKEQPATVVLINEAKENAKVRLTKTKKQVTVPLDAIELDD